MSNTISEASHNLIDQAADSAGSAVQGTQRMASQAVDGVSRSLQAASKQVLDRAGQASDKTVAYIRDEPVKSMLIAAATGAALVALTRFFGRSSN
jgi:ElaB/YqjD/DUF883 family membrane-anchored ribosome-binding protein